MAELDAAEPKKKQKTEQGEMAEEACLCLVTDKELFVIKLSNLKKQEDDIKDWTCLPPPMFEFSLPLPKRDLCPFEFNSKIYMAVSRSKERSILPPESLDGVPAPLYKSFIANTPGSGDVYVYKNSGFYVLCSDCRVWKELNPPPNYSQLGEDFVMFVLHNTLFVSSFTDSCLAHFDPIRESWTVEPEADNNLLNFIDGRFSPEIDPYRTTFPPQISVPLLGLGSSNNYTNYTVCLTHECEVPPLKTPLERVFAIVALYQYLDVCLEGIQPKINYWARFNLVDLGNGKLCAILYYGESDSEPESGALCFSVFTLSVSKDFTALQLDSGAPPMERDFLEVTVHRKCAHTMKNWKASYYIHAFVWPPTKGGRFNHRTNTYY
ncbi:hypothetical protein HN51_063333 [Arachis hypogaea]|nr:uncharacterized protein DS421_11g342330 [Arachis hypogaea]